MAPGIGIVSATVLRVVSVAMTAFFAVCLAFGDTKDEGEELISYPVGPKMRGVGAMRMQHLCLTLSQHLNSG